MGPAHVGSGERDTVTDPVANPNSADTPADFGTGPADVVRRYLSEIAVYDKAAGPWQETVKKIIARYRDERPTPQNDSTKKYSLLWSTIQTQSPALYSRTPVPVVERRWKDNEDTIASMAAEILQRALIYTLEQGDFDSAMDGATWDYQIAGRGVLWLRKEVTYGDPLPADPGQEPVREVLEERIVADEVPWSDFGHSLGRTWREVTIVWRRLYMTRDQLIRRFGAETGNAVELDHTPSHVPAEREAILPPHLFRLATVYEIWDKPAGKVLWIAKDYHDGPCDERDDPLRLRGFFPCPRPAYSSTDTSSLIPLPDYTQWQDQATEVDALTQRLHMLVKAVMVRGIYDGSLTELAQLLDEGMDRDMIGVANWSQFSQAGGLKGSVDFLPVNATVEAISQLYQAREQAKRDAAEISGVGDILRGQNTGPQKTATEARIQGSGGFGRLNDRQKEIQRFARDAIRLMAEMIAEGFQPETLQAMTGYQLPSAPEREMARKMLQAAASPPPPAPGMPPPPAPPPALVQQAEKLAVLPTWDEVLSLLRDDRLRSFTIEIETDSTIAADEATDKQTVSEFFTAVGGFLNAMGPVVMQAPPLMPMAMEMLKFGARRFQAGRTLENAIDDAADKLIEMAANPAPPQPHPEIIKAEAAQQAQQLQIAANQQTEQTRAAAEMRKAELEREAADADAQAKVLEIQTKAQIDSAKLQHERDLKAQELQSMAQIKSAELAHERDLKSQDFGLRSREVALKEAQASHEFAQSAAENDLAGHVKTFGDMSAAHGKAMVDAIGQITPVIEATHAAIANIPSALGTMHQAIAAIHHHVTAEKELVRGPDGRAIGVRIKGVGKAGAI